MTREARIESSGAVRTRGPMNVGVLPIYFQRCGTRYRHDGRGDGSFTWADMKARAVGVGWDFKQIFGG